MEIYVANIPYQSGDEDLVNLFKEYGRVTSARVVLDRNTQQSRGFGFVAMHTKEEAQAAIEGLNGAELHGRKLLVRESLPKGSPDLGGYVPRSQRPGGGNRR